MNGCAFCLRLHVADALAGGEQRDRLAVLSAWRETGYFEPVERAALALVEAVTDIPSLPERSADRAAAEKVLTAEQISAVTWAAIAMNTFNRIAISSSYIVAPGVRR
ncbi:MULTISPECIES: carboxymuconolactone decarboxylase family protein [unclassified Knoellia]|uniref:carboxymuconolactone decarboxylase family protein n=1 Tax=Knoellia altitudinis TaxID=3404795 RepID=UPI00361C92E5